MDDELLFRSALGMLTANEEARVVTWRRRSPDNENRFRELVDLLLLTADSDDQLDFRPAPAAAELIDLATARTQQWPKAATQGAWPTMLRAAAACVALIAAASLILVLTDRRNTVGLHTTMELGPDEFTTEAEPATVGLRDGTLVRIAPQSRLRVHPRDDAREVSLSGRGFFAVAPDPERTFTIRSEAGTVTVLGTRFDLTVEGDNLRLIVVEGTVALTVRGSTIEVHAGQLAQVVKGVLVPPIDVPDPESLLDWVGNFIVFQKTPLSIVASEIEQRHGVHVEFTDPAIKDRTVTAWFAGRSFEEISEVICMVAHLNCTRVGDVLWMAPAP